MTTYQTSETLKEEINLCKYAWNYQKSHEPEDKTGPEHAAWIGYCERILTVWVNTREMLNYRSRGFSTQSSRMVSV